MIQNKLVESWLDNQGERRYQPAFIQLLIAEGWIVLHNTRHSPLEYGKDVIARDPHGKICAIQLKGNPASRVTKSEAQGLLAQFLEAIESEIPTSYGRKSGERHKTIFVTNGEIDEEARELFDRTAERVKNPLCPSDSVEYWTRGDLLRRFSDQVTDIWPTNVQGLAESVKIFGEDGLSIPTPERVATVLRAAFGILHAAMKSPEKSSKITSIFLLSEILKTPWYRTQNHSALFQISVTSSVYALQFADVKKRAKLVENYAALALSHANDLISECKARDYDPNFNDHVAAPLNEIDIFVERARLIAEAASALVLANQIDTNDKAYFATLISGSIRPGCLWGQFVIPSLIVRYWAWRSLDATIQPDLALAALLSGYITAAENHRLPDQITNASPYYRFEEVIYQATNGQLGEESDISLDDTRRHMSFGKAIIQMMAIRNWKQNCKILWRRFSQMMHGSTEVDHLDFFSPALSESGSTTSEQLYDKEWVALVNESIDAANSQKLHAFHNLYWLAASYICLAPHRAEHNFLMALDASVSRSWYSRNHRPGDPISMT